ncbi:TetR family transcriptional regulator [Saccharothrix sp. ALI-22-I]|uniref:TetR/AcrR family transcriptional regulator n=1 Tax=Saccharothrix sp. ALI-22-I TaxID=1933778 RepID=UPI00097C2844|nr:TetR/AcrR family transcriptional regulator [Saccharothrix sp. ALI-22-I]ONI83850.1 TetR family transcriptional regulator [Saccharothrix sp. ALI-22-I]
MVNVRRERFREETKVEAKRIALEQLAEQGIAGISVNAIAKRMGVTGPALYRYFKGRDDLLNDLVRDAWHDLADTVEAAVAASEGAEPPDRVRAFGEAFRSWGVGQPHRYMLLFGTPLPGYQAPDDTLMAAHRTMSAFLSVLPHEGAAPGRATAEPSTLDAQLVAWADSRGEGDVPPAVLLTGLRGFTRLHGVLSLEVTGQFGPMGIDPALLYRAEVESLLLVDSEEVRGSTRLSGPG